MEEAALGLAGTAGPVGGTAGPVGETAGPVGETVSPVTGETAASGTGGR